MISENLEFNLTLHLWANFDNIRERNILLQWCKLKPFPAVFDSEQTSIPALFTSFNKKYVVYWDQVLNFHSKML